MKQSGPWNAEEVAEDRDPLDLLDGGLQEWDPFVDWFVAYWLSRGYEVLRG